MAIRKSDFGKLPDGASVEQYTLANSKSVTVKILTYGGIISEVHAPDRNGKLDDVVVGFDNLEQYLAGHPYFGAIVGRYANRIAKGKFTLDGKTYTLAINNGPNALHGGLVGFDKKVWQATPRELSDGGALELRCKSNDGEEGYPGNLEVTVTYMLNDKNELWIVYRASTDKPTVINLTNHSYWNLAGGGDVLGHELILNAKNFTPSDDTLIPTGEIKFVKGTPFDFTQPKTIGKEIQQLVDEPHRGYDHNFVLDSGGGNMVLAARVVEPKSGRVLEVLTDQPGIQLYTANFLKDTRGKGKFYQKHGAFCLETQHFPDSPNHPNFPSTMLRPDEEYRTSTVFRFSTR